MYAIVRGHQALHRFSMKSLEGALVKSAKTYNLPRTIGIFQEKTRKREMIALNRSKLWCSIVGLTIQSLNSVNSEEERVADGDELLEGIRNEVNSPSLRGQVRENSFQNKRRH